MGYEMSLLRNILILMHGCFFGLDFDFDFDFGTSGFHFSYRLFDILFYDRMIWFWGLLHKPG
jgi:hypothetical protein